MLPAVEEWQREKGYTKERGMVAAEMHGLSESLIIAHRRHIKSADQRLMASVHHTITSETFHCTENQKDELCFVAGAAKHGAPRDVLLISSHTQTCI